MAIKAPQLLAGGRVPKSELPITAAREDASTFGRERGARTRVTCPVNQQSSAPLERSQTRAVPSIEAETARRPSGLKATLQIKP